MHLYPSVYFHFHATDFVETIFKMNMNTLVTRYTDILIFNFAHIKYLKVVFNTTLNPKKTKAV